MKPLIERVDTQMREAISVEERVEITLRLWQSILRSPPLLVSTAKYGGRSLRSHPLSSRRRAPRRRAVAYIAKPADLDLEMQLVY